MTISKHWKNAAITGGLLLLAAALRFYGIGWGLPDVYEEATPLRRAWGMWGWGPDSGFDLNPHFFNYPSLAIYVQFGGQCILLVFMKVLGAIDSTLDFRTLYITRPIAFFVVGRSITALFGIGTVWFMYLIGRRIGGRAVAIPAALLLAVNTVHIANSQLVSVDVPLTFFIMAFLWAVLRLLESPVQKNYIIAGVLLGLATSTKYTGALLLVSLLVAHLMVNRQSDSARRPDWNLLGIAVVFAVIAFYATSPFVLLDSSAFRHDLSAEREHMRLGHFGLDGSPVWQYYARAVTGTLLGWPAAVLALLGLVYFAAVRGRPWAIVLAVFVIVYTAAIATWSMRAERYLIPIIPAALLFAAAGLQAMLKLRPMHRTVSIVAPTALALILAAPVVAGYPRLLERLKPDPRLEARRWIELNVPRGSFVVSEPYGPSLVSPLELWSDASDIPRHIAEDRQVSLYAVQMLPMYQVEPERSEVFYDLSLYRMADVVITSNAVRSRYVNEPGLFPNQVAFYDSLDAGFQILAEFRSTPGAGPTIIVYGNPEQATPFSQRDTAAAPVELQFVQEGTYGGEEGFYYYNMGLNYVTFADPNQALACYELALAYPVSPEARHVAVVERMLRSLRDAGLNQEAVGLLAMAETRAPTESLRQRLRGLRSSH